MNSVHRYSDLRRCFLLLTADCSVCIEVPLYWVVLYTSRHLHNLLPFLLPRPFLASGDTDRERMDVTKCALPLSLSLSLSLYKCTLIAPFCV